MKEPISYYRQLLHQYLDNTITREHYAELFDFAAAEPVLFDKLLQEVELQDWVMETIQPEKVADYISERGHTRLMGEVQKAGAVPEDLIQKNKTAPLIRFWSASWFKYAAAIVLFFGIGAYLYTANQPEQALVKTAAANDIPAPENNRATLTLANGQKIFLDSTVSGILAREGETSIEKTAEGEIIYKAEKADGEMQYNTLTVPRGSQVASIVLSDGSKVFLNAASSLKYPVVFLGSQRIIQITGEAYFEVAKNKTMPFVVQVGNAAVKVLGTRFNVMAYENEQSIETTLLEGSIKISKGSNERMLAPGQQLRLTSSGEEKFVDDADVSKAVAWKNGLFHFENADIGTIMRQIERWYDVDVEFQNSLTNDRFYLEMPRSSKLSDVLKVLTLASKIKFDINGKKITIHS